MAASCSSAPECCAMVCVAVAPQTVQAAVPGQEAPLLWLAPLPFNTHATSWFLGGGAEMHLGVGQELSPVGIVDEQANGHIRPQVFMEPQWPQIVGYGASAEAAQAEDVPYHQQVGDPSSLGAFAYQRPLVWHTPSQLWMDRTDLQSHTFTGDDLSAEAFHVHARVKPPSQLLMQEGDPMLAEYFRNEARTSNSTPTTPTTALQTAATYQGGALRHRRQARASRSGRDVARADARVGHATEVSRNEHVNVDADENDHAKEELSDVDVPHTVVSDITRARALAESLLTQLRVGGGERQSAIASILRLAFEDQVSSRAAQLALQEAPCVDDVALLASSLHGHVLRAIRSMHANHVIQRVVELLPPVSIAFVPRELSGLGKEVARHRFGCRIICRLLEHGSSADRYILGLMKEVLSDAPALCRHTYGNYVVRHCLEFGTPEQRQSIAKVIAEDAFGAARHRYGSRVVQAALQFCISQDRDMIVEKLIQDGNQLLSLAMNLSGRHVVKALLKLPSGNCAERVANIIRPAAARLQSSKYGKVVVDALPPSA
eukprot:TRINITY_DN50681_c0_g1_i1.p1 TRINITY_DN50681_c0_g1~~TRINITY_DN50681_c0_g1_i1.p1  ORF type:complete len:561 (-),score=72.90 TRINITY_DN50681_c0_g1_i1:446-2083(-)